MAVALGVVQRTEIACDGIFGVDGDGAGSGGEDEREGDGFDAHGEISFRRLL
jgi:hypothetical protein